MAKKKVSTYENIENPFNSQLSRSHEGEDDSLEAQPLMGTKSIDSPSQMGGGVVSGGAIDNFWIKSWIKSTNYKPKKTGFMIDGKRGYIEGMDLYMSGSIVGGSIDIGGADATSFHVDTSGNMWLGAATYNITTNPFAVSSGGVIRAVSGTIGGCALGSTSIGSTTFTSGPLGTGWNISNTGTAEFQNAIFRGIIRTSVFEKDTISATNGILLVSKADVLDADMTALDASTLTITGETTFVTNEVIRIKDGTSDEWMLVTNATSAPTYTVTRDLASAYSADANPIWTKGTAVVSMGVGTGDKTGYVLLDSSSSNSPFIDVHGRNSNTYTDTTLHGRLGYLKGITDSDLGLSSTDEWGLYTDNAYIKGKVVVGTTGYVRGGQTDFQSEGDTGFFIGYSSGDYKLSIGEDSAGDNYLTWDGTYLRIKGNLDLTSIFNNISYATADLPIPPTTEGFESPTGNE